MRTSISSIVQKISKASAVVGLSLSLLGGGAAYAGTIEAGMSQGKDYVAAHDGGWDIGASSPALVARAEKALSEMQHGGKDYVAARQRSEAVPSVFAAEELRVQARMASGKDYVAARSTW